MKVAVKNKIPAVLEDARAFEKDGDWKQAAGVYEQLLKARPQSFVLLHRLMIAYRKLKKYRQEISVINKAIQLHEKLYKPVTTKKVAVNALSKKLNQMLGHADKKGRQLIVPAAIASLQKRKAIVAKKISS